MTPFVHRPFVTGLGARALAAGTVTVCAGFVVVVGLLASTPCLRDPEALAPDEAPVSGALALELHVTGAEEGGCMYYSHFDQGAVTVDACSTSEQYTTPFDFVDGCHWESHETLKRVAPGRYLYEYRESPVACAPGHVAAQACVRSGYAIAR